MILSTPYEITQETKDLIEQALLYKKASLSVNTVRAYTAACKKFQAWCEERGFPFMPTSAEVLALYLTEIAKDSSFSTIDVTIAAIESSHRKCGVSISGHAVLYHEVRKGIRRTHKHNQAVRQAKAMTILDLKGSMCRLDGTVKSVRDRALLTVSFFGAFRRSEVVSLDIQDVEFTDKGAIITLLSSKGCDTKKEIYLGFTKDDDICPVRSLQTWINALSSYGITSGAIFRSFMKGGKIGERLSGHSVNNIIKEYFSDEYSGHSCRRGLITSSAQAGAPIHIIKKHSRHKSADMVLHYIEEAKGFDDCSTSVLGV